MPLPSPMRGLTASLVLFCLLHATLAHEHHPGAENDAENLEKPIDAILWLHIAVQVLTWGFLFPIGMVLGIVRSRWHVPLQVTSYALTLGGYILGHAHGGRSFPETIHGVFASILFIPLITQFSIGVYLKLHIHEKTIRPYVVVAHGIIGKAWPILGWCQMLFGSLTLGGYCSGGGLPQCLAHYIMGSAFIGYGILLAVALFVGSEWLRRVGYSQEWFDSWVIMLWGIVNTFTEHRGSLTQWSHKDLQHTMMGVLWWAGGALGIYLARGERRTIVPALIIGLTGWAMSAHEQAMPISTKVHTIFGVVLMSAGLARIIEISFLLRDTRDASEISPPPTGVREGTEAEDARRAMIRSFQHLPPFLLVAGGILFMSATDEELKYIHSLEIDHVTYTLIMFSLAFIIYLYTLFLLNLYFTSGLNNPANRKSSSTSLPAHHNKPENGGYRSVPFTPMTPSYPGVMHDDEVFEMAGDLDEDETEPAPVRRVGMGIGNLAGAARSTSNLRTR